jgi:ribosomal protein S18 acetylase RimI-like enzyme
MILRDWRDADPGLLRSCYDTEQRSWHADLGWDTTWTWSTIETARVTWGLPGLLALDNEGRAQGWTFYMEEGRTRHIGGLVAASPDVTAALLDAVSGHASALACFVRDRAAGLTDALAVRGFDLERFLYLSRPLTPADHSYVGSGFSRTTTRTSPWVESDLPAATALLHAAYSDEAGRYFAPGGTFDAWFKYVRGLVEQGGCGTLDLSATRCVRGELDLEALALITAIAPRTAHLAQLAVRPDCRGRGLASMLVQEVIGAAACAGKTALTLLVGERNSGARRLYASMGFVERGAFVAARRDSSERR